MNLVSVEKICEVTGGRLLPGKKAEKEALEETVSSVVISSKEGKPGALFVPIIGERTDAHNFIKDAYEQGVRVTFTSRAEREPETEDMTYIQVADTKKALQDLGSYYRDCFKGKVIGITGSVGKSTTKEMVAKALSAGYSVLKTAGNKNSQLGVPLMMLELDNDSYNMATFEMGMSEFGEMEKLAAIAKPKSAVVTNIGVAHIANLGSQENIRSEKLRITDYFEDNSLLFVNGDDRLLKDLSGVLPKDKNIKIISFGLSESCDYYAEKIEGGEASTSFVFVDRASGEREQVTIPVIGSHNVMDATAALAVAKHFDVNVKLAAASLAEYSPMNMRGGIEKLKGITLIDDTYNASPDSMRSGLEMLEGLAAGGRKLVVFADVLELGAFSKELHREVGEFARAKKLDKLITIGSEAAYIAEGARGAAYEIKSYPDKNGVFEKELTGLMPGDVVYLKGSRGMRLDIIAESIREAYKA